MKQIKRWSILRFWWGAVLILFSAGSALSSAVAIQIAVAPLTSAPPDPAGYMLAHPWPGLDFGMLIQALIGYFLYRRFVTIICAGLLGIVLFALARGRGELSLQ